MKEFTHLLMIAWGAMALTLGGCSNSVQRSAHVYAPMAAAGETYTQYPPQAVLDSPEIAAYRVQRSQWAADGLVSAEPWWTSRNDGRLNLRPGGNSASVTDSLVYVHDRQYSSNGRVFDTYRRDAYSRSYGRFTD